MCLYRARSGWENALVHGHPFVRQIIEVITSMGKKKSAMTQAAARRIQSAADRSGKNQDFKARVMRAASKRKK